MPIATSAVVLGGLGKIYGSWRAGREAKKGREQYMSAMEGILRDMRTDVDDQRTDIARYLEPEVHRDYMDTAEAQSVMEGARDNLQNIARQVRGGVARTGGTTEATLAGQEVATRGYADVLNRLAGHGTQYKHQARRTLMSSLQGWRGAQQGVHGAAAQHAGEVFGASQQQAAQHAQSGQNWLEAMTEFAGTDPQLPEWLTN